VNSIGLRPQPFREIKRRLEAAGFVDTAIVPKKSEGPVGTLRSNDWDRLG
jgi:hypothetical protein